MGRQEEHRQPSGKMADNEYQRRASQECAVSVARPRCLWTTRAQAATGGGHPRFPPSPRGRPSSVSPNRRQPTRGTVSRLNRNQSIQDQPEQYTCAGTPPGTRTPNPRIKSRSRSLWMSRACLVRSSATAERCRRGPVVLAVQMAVRHGSDDHRNVNPQSCRDGSSGIPRASVWLICPVGASATSAVRCMQKGWMSSCTDCCSRHASCDRRSYHLWDEHTGQDPRRCG